MDCSWSQFKLIQSSPYLPEKVLDILQTSDDEQYFSTLTQLALDPKYTNVVFQYYEPLFPEICARWAAQTPQAATVAAFGRILPFAPHLTSYAQTHLRRAELSRILEDLTQRVDNGSSRTFEGVELLLGVFRLLALDSSTFAEFIRPCDYIRLSMHQHRLLRYLSIRMLCLYLHAADSYKEDIVLGKVGLEPILGAYEGKEIDFHFLSLWEEKRWRDVDTALRTVRLQRNLEEPHEAGKRVLLPESLSPTVAYVCGRLLSRSVGTPSTHVDSVDALVPTPTTLDNVNRFIKGLLLPAPLLLVGLAGAGKTFLVHYVAQKLEKLENLVTLHLNEQSDAKLLIGLYTSGTTPGSFVWRPGVLTRAVTEGRWVLIEDLDRAPSEVLSVILPLIEKGELVVPGREERVRAAQGFKILATMRTTVNVRGEEAHSHPNMLGMRLWTPISVQMPNLDEYRDIVSFKHPSLEKLIPRIMAVYSGFLDLQQRQSQSKRNSTRPLTPTDLLKWCRRVESRLIRQGSYSGIDDDVFLEAVDCFCGSFPGPLARQPVLELLAQELHIDPQRRDYLLGDRPVDYQIVGKAGNEHIRIGRTALPKTAVSQMVKSQSSSISKRFATPKHTLRLLEQVSVAVEQREPLLLVGETGIGKTACIQHLASVLGHRLVTVNLSQQSESGDLLGGFKPVNIRSLITPLKDEFDALFERSFSGKKNHQFLERLGRHMVKGQWKRVCTMWKEAHKTVQQQHVRLSRPSSPTEGEPFQKRRKVANSDAHGIYARWEKFAYDVEKLQIIVTRSSNTSIFSFVEGNVVKAVRNGDWVLLDEINLASSDTLEALNDLFTNGNDRPSILLTEAGNVERIKAHANFRVFAAMNPATDIGKRELPSSIRSRFTELFVESPDTDFASLQSIVQSHLGNLTIADQKASADISGLYMEIQRLTRENVLVDGTGQRPHFSLRSLTRTLTYARLCSPLSSLRRALYEGFCMTFVTFLDRESEARLVSVIDRHLLLQSSDGRAQLNKPLRKLDETDYVLVAVNRVQPIVSSAKSKPKNRDSTPQTSLMWMPRGAEPILARDDYIVTPFVERNLVNLGRAAFTRKFPVLLQGPTSSGKTSMIEFLANKSGNKFVRINNHEHTDLQEYLGTYVSDQDGSLRYQEGVLVQALRQGHWIVLDELNLAPTDVLEALNRLLDDNRELLIPETQEVIRPHENFMLFATQNPAGLYGGRKQLSRAFRNRFLELHFDDIPIDELEVILEQRCRIPKSWCSKIVQVYQRLSLLRQETRVFEHRSFATLRDLFRWAMRKAESIDQLAAHGFMLLAERVRKSEERKAVAKIIEEVMSKKGPKVTVNENDLYSTARVPITRNSRLVWTKAMRRLYVLVSEALLRNEPVLLVGETGCGKTSVCQLLAEAAGRLLHVVNAHQNTETGDLIGAQRPIRNRAAIETELRQQLSVLLNPQGMDVDNPPPLQALLASYDKLSSTEKQNLPQQLVDDINVKRVRLSALFEWSDGSLVVAMKKGHYFLVDEISLADDSVLERLNSVLESSRTILLAEKGPYDPLVAAAEGFQFLATMNPGGDYGKRELSPALRNRFTEIWVPPMSDADDVRQIVASKLETSIRGLTPTIVAFSAWFQARYQPSTSAAFSLRDITAWVNFVNKFGDPDPYFGLGHGAAVVFIDTLGANPAAMLAIPQEQLEQERHVCWEELDRCAGRSLSPLFERDNDLAVSGSSLRVGPFAVSRLPGAVQDPTFSFIAPTTRLNAMRIVRALQLDKPVLLEGNPGVGKTTLVTALAKATGNLLTRINLSEQTDLMDLFGADVPIEGAVAGFFGWRDAPFLRAMKNGEWVLLDEMNLASQSVLEGLNACLDHRGEVFVAELGQTFHRHPDFRVFAAQNPHHQGGGRKGLPTSFVNRFTIVFADVFRPEDLRLISRQIFMSIDDELIDKVIKFVSMLETHVVQDRSFGNSGSPWEFNLRDTIRWLELVSSPAGLLSSGSIRDFLDTAICQRFRTLEDRTKVYRLFLQVFGENFLERSRYHNLSKRTFQVGIGLLTRSDAYQHSVIHGLFNTTSRLASLESLMICALKNWPAILVGPAGVGKTTMLRQLAGIVGAELVEFSMNADIDATDLVGGYEQVDPQRRMFTALRRLRGYLKERLGHLLAADYNHVMVKMCGELEDRLCGKTEDVDLEVVIQLVSEISAIASSPQLEELTRQLHELVGKSQEPDGSRFEWLDGQLIRALEQGQWLVLDNANLCSPSVLDRLNSLLEPNGFLAINEHCSDEGEARIVEPHPNFRIFLTMDPRHGELSRAMRNRAVELFVMPLEQSRIGKTQTGFFAEASVYRFRHLLQLSGEHSDEPDQSNIEAVSLDYLARADLPLLVSFQTQVESGLVDRLSSSFSFLVQNRLDVMSSYHDCFSVVLPTGGSLSDDNIVERVQQTIYPLFNQPAISIPNVLPRALWMAELYEHVLDLSSMSHAIEQASRQAGSVKTATRLQRSLASSRVIDSFKDSTATVAGFLRVVEEALRLWVLRDVRNVTASEQLLSIALSIRDIRNFWWDFFDLVSSANFEEASYWVYLDIAHFTFARIKTDEGHTQHLSARLAQAMKLLKNAAQPKTGQSMERMWNTFKPSMPSSLARLDDLLALEKLATRFDNLMWKLDVPLEEVLVIRRSLAQFLKDTVSDGIPMEFVLETARATLKQLEEGIEDEKLESSPYFRSEFDALYQVVSLHHAAKGKVCITVEDLERLSVLACKPIKTLQAQGLHSAKATQLDVFAILTSHKRSQDRMGVLRSVIDAELLGKIVCAKEVPLHQMRLLQTECSILGRHITIHSASVTENKLELLAYIALDLLATILGCHQDFLDKRTDPHDIDSLSGNGEYPRISPYLKNAECHLAYIESLPSDHYFREICDQYIQPSILDIKTALGGKNEQLTALSRAIVLLSIGCLRLYVPDRPLDPALRPAIEHYLHRRRSQKLSRELRSVVCFEEYFTGQNVNLRTKSLERELLRIGSEPPLATVPRPPKSEMGKLHADFFTVIQMLNQVQISLLEDGMSGPETFEHRLNTIDEIISRLSIDHRAYDDLTGPAIGFLQCLKVGLSLMAAPNRASNSVTSLARMMSSTPLVSATPHTLAGTVRSETPWPEPSSIRSFQHQLLVLAFSHRAGDCAPVHQPSKGFTRLQTILGQLFDIWKTRLSKEQSKAAKQSSLYRFRGDQEAEDAELKDDFHEIFPDFEASTTHDHCETREEGEGPSQLAAWLADKMNSMFGENGSASLLLSDLMHSALSNVSSSSEWDTCIAHAGSSGELLPLAVLSLDEFVAKHGNTRNPVDSQDFYSDENIVEVKKLEHLVTLVTRRTRQIVREFPEHSTLHNIIRICRELMDFRHTEPIAKFLTKTEKLHETIHEWQRIASREYSISNLFDQVTNLLVSWRRLELNTWSKLLDKESKRCEQDSKAWWFIAYENIIAVPQVMAQSNEDLEAHARELVATLESFFKETSIGEFAPRLELLRNFKALVSVYKSSNKKLQPIENALGNYISYIGRYQHDVARILKDKRLALEKGIKEIIQLAAWKDTNIDALRQSAKMSHHKLFKIVRKYREQLGESISTVLGQSPSAESTFQNFTTSINPNESQTGDTDIEALKLCGSLGSVWQARPARYQDMRKTAFLILSKTTVPPDAVDGASYLDAFCEDLDNSIVKLQKATPGELTEDTKAIIKYLKSQKRKLFADTLKELKQMGFKSILPNGQIAKQDSSATILSNMVSFTEAELPVTAIEAETYFYKVLDLLHRARRAATEHSEDLSSAEVARSLGYIESLLSTTIKQRHCLAANAAGTVPLEATIRQLESLWLDGQCAVKLVDLELEATFEAQRQTLSFIVPILNMAVYVTQAHGRLGGTDVSGVIDALNTWAVDTDVQNKRAMHLTGFKSGLWHRARKDMYDEDEKRLQIMKTEIERLKEDLPEISYVLDQVLRWLEPTSRRNSNVANGFNVPAMEDISKQLFRTLDTILGAMQDVERAAAHLSSSSSEDKAWLRQEDNYYRTTLSALRTKDILQALASIVTEISHLPSQGDLNTASALVRVAMPIIRQYQVVHSRAMTQYATLHRSTCKLSYHMIKSFTQIAARGFCSPSDKAVEQDGKEGDLEAGTGLGDGEGAEDISKDIGVDEDLTELAQDSDHGKNEQEIEEEKDAVEMQDEMAGALDDSGDKGEEQEGEGSDNEEEQEDIDEEVGDVDGLEPSAVDEKQWAGDENEEQKQQEDEKSKGAHSKDQQIAGADEQGSEDEIEQDERRQEDENIEDEENVEEQEHIEQGTTEQLDPHVQQEEPLDLPDDMAMDQNQKDADDHQSSDGFDDALDVSDHETQQPDEDMVQEDTMGDQDETEEGVATEADEDGPGDEMDVDQEQGAQETDHDENCAEPADYGGGDQPGNNDSAQGLGGLESKDYDEETSSANKAKQDAGQREQGGDESGQPSGQGEESGTKRQEAPGSGGPEDDAGDTKETRLIRQLGNDLEQWHRQHKRIREAQTHDEHKQTEGNHDVEMQDGDFEHLPDDRAEADTQALGAANEEQAKALDEAMGLPGKQAENDSQFPAEQEDAKSQKLDESEMEDMRNLERSHHEPQEQGKPSTSQHGLLPHPRERGDAQDVPSAEASDDYDEIEDALIATHLDSTADSQPRTLDESRALWTALQARTSPVSLTLTEQLRLILAPTLASKLRGDYRTGKRLNIRRIIPYIASSYRRDKIWMRRAVPSKRQYQIMLAVDDSKSMTESGADAVALEALVTVARSLSMLEAGELSVVAFGETVHVAHDFGLPFSGDAGPSVFSKFRFQQTKTDVRKLAAQSIQLFRDARSKAHGSGAQQLWQLQLIISDGVCEDHEGIAQLVRQAQEERIMVVFVIVDVGAARGQSIMDLGSYEFITGEDGKPEVKKKRYLDSFPFRYYVVVREIAELPGVLAGALRQWFSEVAETG